VGAWAARWGIYNLEAAMDGIWEGERGLMVEMLEGPARGGDGEGGALRSDRIWLERRIAVRCCLCVRCGYILQMKELQRYCDMRMMLTLAPARSHFVTTDRRGFDCGRYAQSQRRHSGSISCNLYSGAYIDNFVTCFQPTYNFPTFHPASLADPSPPGPYRWDDRSPCSSQTS
jgi:hypothetical protein